MHRQVLLKSRIGTERNKHVQIHPAATLKAVNNVQTVEYKIIRRGYQKPKTFVKPEHSPSGVLKIPFTLINLLY